MKNELSNIEIGKSYPADYVLGKMNEDLKNDIKFGHILVEYETEKRHKYFINKDFIKKLKDTSIKVYTIITIPNCHNFAYRLLEQKDIKDILENINESNNLCCILDQNDLMKAGYVHKNMKKAIMMINKVFKTNKMTFKASSHPEGIKIIYKKEKIKKVTEELK